MLNCTTSSHIKSLNMMLLWYLSGWNVVVSLWSVMEMYCTWQICQLLLLSWSRSITGYSQFRYMFVYLGGRGCLVVIIQFKCLNVSWGVGGVLVILCISCILYLNVWWITLFSTWSSPKWYIVMDHPCAELCFWNLLPNSTALSEKAPLSLSM